MPTTLDYLISSVGSGTYQKDSSYQIEILATNAQGEVASGSFTFTGTYAPPAVTGTIPAQSLAPDTAWGYAIPAGVFSDPYGHGLSYTAQAPAWLSFANGVFSLPSGNVAAGSYPVTVTATDGLGRSVSTSFTVTVASVAPVFSAAAPNLTVTQNTAFQFQVPGATDANGLAPTYTAWLGGTGTAPLPAWLQFDAATRTFSGTPPSSGSWTIAYGATAGGFAPTQSFVLTVNATPTPPQYVGSLSGQDFSYLPLDPVAIDASGQFHDPQGEALTYTVMQSNGNPLPTWLHFDPSTQQFTGTAPNLTTANDRIWTLQLAATDASGWSASLTFMIDVQGPETTYHPPTMLAMRAPLAMVAAPAGGAGGSTTMSGAATPAATLATATPDIQSYWFTYDADNRVVVNNGALVNGQIVVTRGTYADPSYANSYDAAGNVVFRTTVNAGTYTVGVLAHQKTYDAGDVMSQRMVYDTRNQRVESDYALDLTQHETSLGAQDRYTYDADGHRLSDNTYLRSDAVDAVYGTNDFPRGWDYVPIGGWLASGQVSGYDADGQVTAQVSYRSPDRPWLAIANRYANLGTLPDGGQDAVPSLGSDGPLVVGSVTHYTAFDHTGNVTAYSYTQNPAPGTTTGGFGASYTVSYLKKDGYLEQATSGTPTVPGYTPAVDQSYYDAFGQRIAVGQINQPVPGAAPNTARVFAYDGQGEIIERRGGTVSGASLPGSTLSDIAISVAGTDTNTTFSATGGNATGHYVYANGQALSALDEAGGISGPGSTTDFSSGDPSRYVVQQGDTLASIAQAQYGNSQYGYLIAEANGLASGDQDLVVGQAITIPTVRTEANTASTFKPYNPGTIIGSTTPSLPAAPPPPPSSSGCGMVAMIIVAVAVAIIAPEIAPVLASAMGGGTVATAAGYVMAGAAADTVGQVTADAVGASNGYSWKEAVISGLTFAASAGVAHELGVGTATASGSTWVNSAGHLTFAGGATTGAAGYAVNVAASHVVGQASNFSWDGLLAASLGSGGTAASGLPTRSETALGIPERLEAGIAGGVVQGAVTREASIALGDHRVQSWQNIFADAFGNALGNAAIAGVNAYEASKLPSIDAPTLPLDVSTPTLIISDVAQIPTHVQGMPLVPNGEQSVASADGVTMDDHSEELLSPSSKSGSTDWGSVINPSRDWQNLGSNLPYSHVSLLDEPLAALGIPDLLAVPSIFSRSPGWQDSPIDVLTKPYWNPLLANVHTGLGGSVDALIALSPTLTTEVQYLQATGWSIGYGPSTDASNTLYRSGVEHITISGSYQGNDRNVVSQLSHEVGHALTLPTLSSWMTPLTPAALVDNGYFYASNNTNINLVGEGFATLNNIAVQQEISASASIEIGVASAHPLENIPKYLHIYGDYVNGESSFAAASQIGDIYRNNETPGGDLSKTSGSPFYVRYNGISYGTVYFNTFLNNISNRKGGW